MIWKLEKKKKYYSAAESSRGALRLAPLAFVAAEDLAQAIYYLNQAINYFGPRCLHGWEVVCIEVKVPCLHLPFHLKHGHVKSQVILRRMLAPGLQCWCCCFWRLNRVKHSNNSIYLLQWSPIFPDIVISLC